MRAFAQLLIMPFPWAIRRLFYRHVLGFELAPACRIGRSLFLNIGRVTMAPGSRIGDANMIRNLDRLDLGAYASIGTFNWIAGNRTGQGRSFHAFPQRRSTLSLGEHAAIVARHIIDCTDAVSIGRFSTIAGHRSQFLTHSIDIRENVQACAPISIGEHCFVGTGVIVLKGAVLPNRSVLAAGAVLIAEAKDDTAVYAGNPARKVKDIDAGHKYIVRETGFVT